MCQCGVRGSRVPVRNANLEKKIPDHRSGRAATAYEVTSKLHVGTHPTILQRH